MKAPNKFLSILENLIVGKGKAGKSAKVLSLLVVFVTTYMLILPAFTLDGDTAAEQGGIDVPAVEDTVDIEEPSEDTAEPAEEPEKESPPAEKAPASEPESSSAPADPVSQADPLKYEGDGYTIAIDDSKSVLPGDASIDVKEIISDKENKELYKKLSKETLDAVRKETGSKTASLAFVRFYDISIMSGNETIEPDGKVNVMIEYDKDIQKEFKVSDTDNVRIIHFVEDKKTGERETEILDKKTVEVNTKKDKVTDTTFEAESFSVYGVVYTVDFEYDVDGEKFSTSVAGGDALSLRNLVESLKVITDNKDSVENEIDLFMNEIESVSFSDDSLLDVSKAAEDTTVGAIKEARGLDCEYSSDLTDDDIAAINSKSIKAGDWAIISLKAFETEQTLTIKMKNGDKFTIKVLDDNKSGTPDSGFFDDGTGYILYTVVGDSIYVLDTNGTPWLVNDMSDLDTMGVDYKWHFEYVYKEQSTGENYYRVHPLNNDAMSLALNFPDQQLVQQNNSQIAIIPDGDGYMFRGYNNTRLAIYDGWFAGASNGDYCRVMIYEQEHPDTFNFTVNTSDPSKGTVSGQNASGQNESGESYTSITNVSSGDSKTNRYNISAVPNNKYANNPQYLFDHWELDGNPLDRNTYGQTIQAGRLTFNHNNSVLTAVFVDNPAYDPHAIPDSDKEGTPINKEELQSWLDDLKNQQKPLDASGCKKTAEVYDYENRIYRVDLTSKASLATFEGTIDLGFIIDVSASMLFPSKLDPISSMSNIDIRYINDNGWGNRKNWQNWGFQTNRTYYLISDETGTSTVVRLFYNGSEWRSIDASKTSYNSSATINEYNVTHNQGGFKNGESDQNNNYHYQIYQDGDNGKTRQDYLEASLTGTMSELQDILGILSVAADADDDPDVNVAWNTFKNYLPNGPGQLQHEFLSAKDGIDLEFDADTYGGGTSTDVALLDAAGVNRSDVNNRYSDTDRTSWRTDVYERLRYTNANNGFQWTSGTRYAVLITDGAPQRNGKTIDRRYVEEAAAQLKAKGVTLITVGLGMDNVTNGKILLYDIADVGQGGTNLFYSAKSGDELQYVLLEIIRQIIKDATVQGDVTDTIDAAFYPVDKATGKPIGDGKMIDLEGNLTTDTSKPHGTVTRNHDGTYTIDWVNQDFTVDGWHGTVYVKAKEDLLGGIAMETNVGDARITANTYTVPGYPDPVPLKNDLPTKEITRSTPYVNVNELGFTHNDNEWTVYLGTDVDPKAELVKMYDNVKVNEVVTDAEDTDSDGLPDKLNSTGELRYPLVESISDQREGSASGDPKYFYLKDLIKKITNGAISDGSDLDWDKLIADAEKEGDLNEGITIPYHEYGLDDDSYINIKLTKTVVAGEQDLSVSPHATTVTGQEVEKYTLSILYSPDYKRMPVEQGGQNTTDFKTGSYGTKNAGYAPGTEDSQNVHKINVFKKGLQFTKMDETFTNPLDGAEFELFTVDSSGAEHVVAGLTKNGAVFTIDTLEKLDAGEEYYIRETVSPPGYDTLQTPLKVTLTINDSYTIKHDGEAGETTTQKPADTEIYDWTETGDVTLSPDYTRLVDQEGNEIGHVVTDSTDGMSYYQIMNTPGVELPHAGGIGTTIFYVLGSILLLGCSVFMAARRRIMR